MRKYSIKDQFKRIAYIMQHNKWVTIGVIIGLAVVLSFGTIAIAKQTGKKQPRSQNDTTFSAGLILQNMKPPKATEAETETEEEVAEEDVDQFFDEVINKEDEEALDLSQIEPHAVCEPYDGANRAISCWGDSMTFGVGTGSNSASYPGVLETLTGRTVYNMGGASESSLQIATRQGAYGMYIDRDITINEESDAIVRFISDYDGRTISYNDGPAWSTDASGYSFRADPINNIAGLCYVDGTPVIASYAGDEYMSLKYCPEALSLQLALVDTGNRRCSKISALTDQVLLGSSLQKQDVQSGGPVAQDLSDDTEQGSAKGDAQAAGTQAGGTQEGIAGISDSEADTTQGATDNPANAEAAAPGKTDGTTAGSTDGVPQGTTQATTPAVTVPVTTEEPTTSRILTDISIHAGASVKTRAALERIGDILILEIGSNGGWGSNYQVLINQYNHMIDSAGCKYFIVLGDTDDPGTSVGDENQEATDRYGNYIGIGDTAWEATLRKAYGGHFVNMRVELIQHGLDYAGMSPTSNDLQRFGKGFISDRLRSDWTHLNAAGYAAKARVIYEKGLELGYWG